jgi:hypothetical protein
MNRYEAGLLLALCSAFDARTVGDADVKAWADVLADIPFDDAQDAVKDHYARETEFIKPAHVIAGVKRIRRDRVEHADASFVPSPEVQSFEDYQRELLEHRRAVGDGAEVERPELAVSVPPKAIANTFRSVPRGEVAS